MLIINELHLQEQKQVLEYPELHALLEVVRRGNPNFEGRLIVKAIWDPMDSTCGKSHYGATIGCTGGGSVADYAWDDDLQRWVRWPLDALDRRLSGMPIEL